MLDFPQPSHYNIVNTNQKAVILLPNTLAQSKLRILSGSMLKLIAIICMTIDHTASHLRTVLPFLLIPISIGSKSITMYWIMRQIGRLAFPIFCFLIAEGYQHTRNKKQYSLRLLIFAIISEIPFNLRKDLFFDPSSQNVYFTLFLGLMLICAYEGIRGEIKKFLVMAVIALIAMVLKADYGLKGALLVFLIHMLRNRSSAQAVLAYPLLSGGIAALAAFIPINMYNGKRGFIKTPLLKILFYVYYPLHILVLAGIRYMLK